MLELQINQAGQKIILTLVELKTLDDPYYLFVFRHIETKQEVKIVRSTADDESGFPSRYNQFNIDTSTVFLGKPAGSWNYEVYEQESAVNTDPALATGLIEKGKLILYAAAEMEFEKYNTPTSYKTYNG